MRNGLRGLAPGDEFMAPIGFEQDRFTRRTVVTAGRAWVTDDHGSRYRIEDGRSAQHETMFRYAMTTEDYAQHLRDEENREVLRRWQMYSPRLASGQLDRVAALLREFELPEIPAPEDPGKLVYVRVSIEPRFRDGAHTEVIELTEGEIAARPRGQRREDRIIYLAEDYVNEMAPWGATEIEDPEGDGDGE